MTYQQTLKPDQSAFDAIADGLREAPNLMATAVRREIPRIRRRALKKLHQEPPRRSYPNDYPLKWTNDKQRRKYFATNGFGRGIPYRRTGKLVEAWEVKVQISGDDGTITVENSSPSAQFVIGDRQQQFHRNTGWYQADDLLLNIAIETTDVIEELWVTVADESAGIR